MTGTQTLRAVAYGLAFWFAAAMVVRHAPLFDGGVANAVLLIVTIPIAWASIAVGRIACGVGRDRVLDAHVVATIAATLADGIGLTFLADHLYAGITPASQFGAAWILWGVGLILLFAMRAGRKR